MSFLALYSIIGVAYAAASWLHKDTRTISYMKFMVDKDNEMSETKLSFGLIVVILIIVTIVAWPFFLLRQVTK